VSIREIRGISKDPMNKYFRISSLLLYILSMIGSFITGGLMVRWLGLADQQGMTGGATVFMAGIIGAGVGLGASLFLASMNNRKMNILINVGLFVVLIILLGILLG